MTTICPCRLGEPYEECCGRYHRGEAVAPTAERLMRSRFSAFAVNDVDYLLRSWHPSTRPATLELDPDQRWIHLEILRTAHGSLLDEKGIVEFRAHYRQDGRRGSLHEISRFVKEDGEWFYVEGTISDEG